MLKPCLEHASSNAQAFRRVTLCGWRARPMATMSSSCAAAAEVWGRSPVQSLIATSIAPWAKGVGRIAVAPDENDLETLNVSSRLVSCLTETPSCFRGSKGEIRGRAQRNPSKTLQKCFGLGRLENRLAHVSCLVSPVSCKPTGACKPQHPRFLSSFL